jgi:L-lactate dehydrogenase complex protein LldF
MSETPTTIEFGTYTRNIPPTIPTAVQQATTRFLATRQERVDETPEWEKLRQAASDLRLHTLNHLDYYLEMLQERVTSAGGVVHWARDAAEASAIVVEIACQHNVKTAVKVKSMATEEIGLNQALDRHGITTYETDLGEFIIQLDGTGPSHIIAPAVHFTKEEIADLFRTKLGVEAQADPVQLTTIARKLLREKFLSAEMGISGANFLIAETGTLVIVTNEGNGRMCTTLPNLHVAIAGIDKVIPDWETLTVLLKLLPRSASGQKISTYTSFITGPRRSEGEFGPKEFHLVLLDNGRSRMLRDPIGRETLKCIRCGCCLNVCPVYQNVGGFAYGWFISGPIGAIFSPQILGVKAARELPFASTLCGACADVCPVKIPIPEILLQLRHRVVEGDNRGEIETLPDQPSISIRLRVLARLSRLMIGTPWLYRFGTRLLPLISAPFQRDGWILQMPPPANRWTSVRPFPAFSARFRQWWKRRKVNQ